MWYRAPQVAGYFYPEDRDTLIKVIESCFLSELGPGKLPGDSPENIVVKGLVSPHAGYIYSGPIAAWGFLRLASSRKPKKVVIMGPNHRGIGPEFAIFPEGVWETPLGKVEIDKEFSYAIMEKVNFLEPSEVAHRYEHSIEVQIPFLQYVLKEGFSIIPILVSSYDIYGLVGLGEAIAALDLKDVLILASSDFSHYIDAKTAETIDKRAISYILKRDPSGFLIEVVSKRLSICGAGPITVLISSLRGDTVEPKLLKYGNSGDVTGDFSEVVGYASISFEEKI